jgi:hypothetical protein
MDERWFPLGTLTVESGLLIIATTQAAGTPQLSEAVDAQAADLPDIGLDLRPVTGMPAFLIPTGYGDGVYPVSVRVIEDADGRQRVAEVSVRFVAEG